MWNQEGENRCWQPVSGWLDKEANMKKKETNTLVRRVFYPAHEKLICTTQASFKIIQKWVREAT